MKLFLILVVISISSTIVIAKEVKRLPAQSVLTIKVEGSYDSPKNEPAEVQLNGKALGLSLGSRYDLFVNRGYFGSRRAKIEGEISCKSEDECTIYFDK